MRVSHAQFGVALSAIASAALLCACGGGGGSGDTPPPVQQTATISGVAAQGAAMANASVTLTDATGQQLSTTTDAAGAFTLTIDLTKFKAPFGFEAVDPSGASENQESILVAKPAAGSTTIVNITPLTSAVTAGSISSGSPYDITKPAVLSTVSAADVKAANDAIVALLGKLLADAKVALPVDLVSSPFAANHTGLDQVVDEVLAVPVGTGMQLTNKLNYAGSSQVAIVSKATVATLGPAFTVDFPTSQIAAGAFDGIKSAWLACFAQPPATRLSNGTLSPACQAAASSNPAYLSNGYTFAKDYSNWFSDANLTNATMVGPTVVYATSATRALLQFTLVGTSGDSRTSNVIAQLIGGQWQITGNQDAYDVSIVSDLIHRSAPLRNGAGTTSYVSAIGPIYRVGPNSSNPSNTKYVVVTGPGFPASGVVLAPNPGISGLSYWPIANQTGTPAARSTTSTNIFKLAQVGLNADGTISPLGNLKDIAWLPTPVTDFTQFAGFPEYTFVLYFSDGTSATVKKRMQYSVVAPANGTGFVWDTLSDSSLALLSGSQPAAASVPLSWTRPLGAAGAANVFVTASDGVNGAQNQVALASDATSISVNPPSGVAQFPAMTTAAAYRWFQLTYRTPMSVGRFSVYDSAN